MRNTRNIRKGKKRRHNSLKDGLLFRDSLTELENFIDSYAAEEETDDDDEAEGK